MNVEEVLKQAIENPNAWGLIRIHHGEKFLYAHYMSGKIDGERFPGFILNAVVQTVDEDASGDHRDINIVTKGDDK